MNPYPVPGPFTAIPATVPGPPLLELFRLAARVRGDSQPTADTLVSWARAFILFHNKAKKGDASICFDGGREYG